MMVSRYWAAAMMVFSPDDGFPILGCRDDGVPTSPLPDTRLAVRADAGCASPPRATGGDDIRGPATRRGSTLCAVFIGHQEAVQGCDAQWRHVPTRGVSQCRDL
jgi:hypothetical protein